MTQYEMVKEAKRRGISLNALKAEYSKLLSETVAEFSVDVSVVEDCEPEDQAGEDFVDD